MCIRDRQAGLHVLGPLALRNGPLVPAERSAARLAHQSGGLGVPSSNLGAPTNTIRYLGRFPVRKSSRELRLGSPWEEHRKNRPQRVKPGPEMGVVGWPASHNRRLAFCRYHGNTLQATFGSPLVSPAAARGTVGGRPKITSGTSPPAPPTGSGRRVPGGFLRWRSMSFWPPAACSASTSHDLRHCEHAGVREGGEKLLCHGVQSAAFRRY